MWFGLVTLVDDRHSPGPFPDRNRRDHAPGGDIDIIVGSVEVLYRVVSGQTSVGTYLGAFMVPALLGNVVGGLSLVTGLNHAQVVSGGGSGIAGSA